MIKWIISAEKKSQNRNNNSTKTHRQSPKKYWQDRSFHFFFCLFLFAYRRILCNSRQSRSVHIDKRLIQSIVVNEMVPWNEERHEQLYDQHELSTQYGMRDVELCMDEGARTAIWCIDKAKTCSLIGSDVRQVKTEGKRKKTAVCLERKRREKLVKVEFADLSKFLFCLN